MDIVTNLLSVVSHRNHNPYHNSNGQDISGYRIGKKKEEND